MTTNFVNNEEFIIIESDIVRNHSLAYAILLDRIRLFHNYDHLNTDPTEPYCVDVNEMSKIWGIKKEKFENEYETITQDCNLYSSREGEDWNFYFFF